MQTPSSKIDPVRAHRRAVWLKIIAPVVLPFLALLGLFAVLIAGIASGDLESAQLTTVMSVVATLFIALPLVLLCLVPYALFAALAVLGGRGYAQAKRPLRFTRRMTEQIAVKTDQIAPRLTQPLVNLNVTITKWEQTVRNWQPEPAQPGAKESDDDQRLELNR